MKFRKGGKLEIVKSYKYLGIMLQVTGQTHRRGNSRDKGIEPIVHSNSPEIFQHKGCTHCHMWHTTHMEPPYILKSQTTRSG